MNSASKPIIPELVSFRCSSPQSTGQFWQFTVRPDMRSELLEFFSKDPFRGTPVSQTRTADLHLLPRLGLLAKRIRAQKAADYFRRCFRSQGKREFHGSLHMAAAGLNVPEPFGYAFNLVPWSRFDSIFLTRYLPDHIPANAYLAAEADPARRQELLRAAARDLSRMLHQNIFHKDAHLGNILVHPSRPGGLSWIDNDISIFPESRRSQMERALLSRWNRKAQFLSPQDLAWFASEFETIHSRQTG